MSKDSNSGNVWGGLLPKTETQSAQFCEKHPYWDGRGVVVGIMDTGVCPAAIGLQKTPDGRPKVIDIIDCTGSGDVLMSDWIKPSDEGFLTHDYVGSLRIKINPAWVNPTGQYRVGCKSAIEMYPGGLVPRMKEERKKQWCAVQKKCELALQQEILRAGDASADAAEDMKLRLSQLKTLGDSSCDSDASVGPIYPCLLFHNGEEYVACIDSSESVSECVSDMSTMCTMREYHRAQEYRMFSSMDCLSYGIHIYDEGAILSIVTDAGAHASHVAGIVGAYHPSQPECNGVAPGAQIVSLKIGDSRLGSMETGVGLCRAVLQAKRSGCHVVNMSYGEASATENQGQFVKLLDELVHKHGILFVTSAGNSGPCLSTVGAPGGTTDSVISVGAMVTHSLMKTAYAMIGVNKETNFTWSSVGPSIEGARGVCVVAPGGAVTSVPSWTLSRNQLMNGTSMSSPNCCGCIALLLSALLQSGIPYTAHSVRRAVEHSARPMPDMDPVGQGYGLIQVEAAWEALLQTHRATAGATARPDGVVPYSISVMSERFSRGIYLRQAYETSIKNTFKVDVSPMFTPTFGLATDGDRKLFNQRQTEYEYRVRLVSSQPWITCPDRALMVNAGKVLSITVDPRGLETERVFCEWVRGYLDTSADEAAPADTTQPFLFEVPITVIRPKVIAPSTSQLVLKNMKFTDSTRRHRRFLVPPPGCQFIDCVITDTRQCNSAIAAARAAAGTGEEEEGEGENGDLDDETSTYVSDLDAASPEDQDGTTRMMMVHALQLFRGTPFRDNEKKSYLQLRPGQTQVLSFAVTAGVMLEICTGLFWSTIGAINCDMTLKFRGVDVSPSTIVIPAGCRVCPEKIRIASNLAPELDIAPAGALDKWHSVIQPTATGVVRPLLGDVRDAVWGDEGTIWYYMSLEYSFEHAEGSSNNVVPRFPGLQGILYESSFHAQFMKVYEVTDIPGKAGRALVGVGDAFPDVIKLVPKKKYVLQLQVRSHEAAALEGLADVPLVLERTLKTPVPLACFETQAEAIAGSKGKNMARGIVCGGSISYYIREPAMDSLPKGVAPGELLTGQATFMKKNDAALGSLDRPKGYPVKYICGPAKAPPAPAAPPAAAAAMAAPTKESADAAPVAAEAEVDAAEAELKKALDSALQEAKFKLLKGMVGGKDAVFSKLHSALLVEFPSELAPRVSALKHAEALAKKYICYNSCSSETVRAQAEEAGNAFKRVVECAEQVIALVDTATLAGSLGVMVDKDNAKAVAAKKEAEGKKSTLVEALVARSLAELGRAKYLEGLDATDASALACYELVEGSYHQELGKWEAVATSAKCWRLVVESHKRAGRWGSALKRVEDVLAGGAEGEGKELAEEKLYLLEKLGWTHILDFGRRCKLLNLHSTAAYRELKASNNKANGSF